MGKIRWTQASRQHRVGRHHALHVMAHAEASTSLRPSGEQELTWVGLAADGWPLTVIAVVLTSGDTLVVHAQPAYREKP